MKLCVQNSAVNSVLVGDFERMLDGIDAAQGTGNDDSRGPGSGPLPASDRSNRSSMNEALASTAQTRNNVPVREVYLRMASANGGVKLAERTWRYQSFPSSFTGAAAVDWLMREVHFSSRADAVQLGNRLIEDGYLHFVLGSQPMVDGPMLYQFNRDIPVPTAADVGELVEESKGESAVAGRQLSGVAGGVADRFNLEDLVNAMRQPIGGVTIKPRFFVPRYYNQCFKGSEATKWFMNELGLSHSEALDLGKAMLERGYFAYVSPIGRSEYNDRNKSWYRFAEDEEEVVLNGGEEWSGRIRAPNELSEKLLGSLIQLVTSYISTEEAKDRERSNSNSSSSSSSQTSSQASPGGRVQRIDVPRLTSDPKFHEFCKATKELRELEDLQLLPHYSRMAFWLNVFNLLSLHTHLLQRVVALDSRRQRIVFFMKKYYIIGRKRMCLDDIEHGILRSNRAFLRVGNSSVPYFDGADSRKSWSMASVDARMHFALYTGALSSPALYIYTPENVHALLSHAALNYLGETVQMDAAIGKLLVPPQLNWYQQDFGENVAGRVQFVADMLPAKSRELLERHKARLSFLYGKYQWQTLYWIKPLKLRTDEPKKIVAPASSRTPVAPNSEVLTLSSVLEPSFGFN